MSERFVHSVMNLKQCYVPGGVQQRLVPWAYLSMVFYAIGTAHESAVDVLRLLALSVNANASVLRLAPITSIAGMPVGFAALLWHHRNKIRADQGLRARGIGSTSKYYYGARITAGTHINSLPSEPCRHCLQHDRSSCIADPSLQAAATRSFPRVNGTRNCTRCLSRSSTTGAWCSS